MYKIITFHHVLDLIYLVDFIEIKNSKTNLSDDADQFLKQFSSENFDFRISLVFCYILIVQSGCCSIKKFNKTRHNEFISELPDIPEANLMLNFQQS